MAIDENVKIEAELEVDKEALKDNLKTALGGFGDFAKKATKLLGALSLGALFKEGFETAIEQEQTSIRIGTILRNRFGLESDIRGVLEAQTEALSKNSIFRKNELQAAQETLLLSLKGTEAVEAATQSAMLLTTALYGANAGASELSSTSEKIADALRYGNFNQFENQFSGEIGLSQEQISYMSQFNTETERANALLGIMKDNFGETANEVKDSFGGSMKETMGRFQDLATSIASNVLPVFTQLFDLINAIADAFGGLQNILIGFMIFMLAKFVYGFITTTLPALLGMGLAKAFAMGGIPGFLAGLGIAGAIGGAIGIGMGGIMAMKGSLSKSQDSDTNTSNSSTLDNLKTNDSKQPIVLNATIVSDPIDGMTTKIKRQSISSGSRFSG